MTISEWRRKGYYTYLGADGPLRKVISAATKVLDVGCSDGRGSVVLSERSVDGVDIYRPALTQTRHPRPWVRGAGGHPKPSVPDGQL